MGALTSKPYSFRARPWELRSYDTYDFFDSFSSAIRIDLRGNQILRIVPRPDFILQSEWINDRTRFCVDGLKRQRLATPLIKKKGSWKSISWRYAIKFFLKASNKIKNNIDGVAGKNIPFPVLHSFKALLNKLGSKNVISDFILPDSDNLYQPSFFDLNQNLNKTQAVILINTNLRLESPLLNLRLRQERTKFQVYSLGTINSAFIQNLGSLETFFSLIKGKHNLNQFFSTFDNIHFYIGANVFSTIIKNSSALINTILTQLSLYNNSISLATLFESFSDLSSSYLNYSKKLSLKYNTKSILYLLGSDNFVPNLKEYNLVVYHGSHGDKGSTYANLVFPAATLFESKDVYSYAFDGSFIKFNFAYKGPLEARSYLYTLYLLRKQLEPKRLVIPPRIYSRLFSKIPLLDKFHNVIQINNISSQHLHNFYLTDAISKASPTLALASARFFKTSEVRYNFKHKY